MRRRCQSHILPVRAHIVIQQTRRDEVFLQRSSATLIAGSASVRCAVGNMQMHDTDHIVHSVPCTQT